jgi:predicted RNase H-like nuclease
MLKATRYEQVRTQGLSVQSFNIWPKIREVDQLMTPGLQQRVYEAHPELAFMSLAGAPMQYNKKTYEGQEERTQALHHWLPPGRASVKSGKVILSGVKNDPLPLEILLPSAFSFPRSHVAPDDLLDACALARTAFRISNGTANQLPTEPSLDAKGLRMEIWF